MLKLYTMHTIILVESELAFGVRRTATCECLAILERKWVYDVGTEMNRGSLYLLWFFQKFPLGWTMSNVARPNAYCWINALEESIVQQLKWKFKLTVISYLKVSKFALYYYLGETSFVAHG